MTSTLIDRSIKLVMNDDRSISQLKYASVVSSLIWVMHCACHSITYVVGVSNRFISNPRHMQCNAIQRVFGSLKKTMNYTLHYNQEPVVLGGFTNVSWIIGSDTSKSTSRWIFILIGATVSWASKKQTCTSHYTMESEFVDLVATGK